MSEAELDKTKSVDLLAFVRRCIRSTVLLEVDHYDAENGSQYRVGTGMVISRERRLIMTAQHVIDGVEHIRVAPLTLTGGRVVEEQRFPLVVIGENREHDVAVLQVKYSEKLPEEFAIDFDAGQREPETHVWHFGKASVWNEGQITKVVSDMYLKPCTCLTDIPVLNGDSGGPVVSDQGKLIGMVLSGVEDKMLFISMYHAMRLFGGKIFASSD